MYPSPRPKQEPQFFARVGFRVTVKHALTNAIWAEVADNHPSASPGRGRALSGQGTDGFTASKNFSLRDSSSSLTVNESGGLAASISQEALNRALGNITTVNIRYLRHPSAKVIFVEITQALS